MSKSLFKIALLAVLTAATMNSCSKNAANQPDGSATADVNSAAVDAQSGDRKVIADFITDMYNNSLYWEEDFLMAHCTPNMLQILKDHYDYEGEGYAFWIFRTDSNDSTGGEVISVTTDDGQWFNYKFTDGGYKGENRLKCYVENGNVWIDDYEKVYDETHEAYETEN